MAVRAMTTSGGKNPMAVWDHVAIRPPLIGDHSGVAVVAHLLHVRLEGAASAVGITLDRSMNNLWPHAGFWHRARRLRHRCILPQEPDFAQVGHAVGAIHAGCG